MAILEIAPDDKTPSVKLPLEQVDEPTLGLPGFEYLTRQNVHSPRKNAYGLYVLLSLLAPQGNSIAKLDHKDGIKDIPNLDKARLLGHTALSFDALKVGIIDLSYANTLTDKVHINRFMAEVCITNAELFILSAPDNTDRDGDTRTVHSIMSARLDDFPVLSVSSDAVSRLQPFELPQPSQLD